MAFSYNDIGNLSYIKRVTLDLSSGPSHLQIYAKQNDENSRYIEVTVIRNGEVFAIPDKAIARLRSKKANGKVVYAECDIYDNKVFVDLSSVINTAGSAVADVEFTVNKQILSTQSFIVSTCIAPFDSDDVEDSDDFSAFREAILRLAYLDENGMVVIPDKYILTDMLDRSYWEIVSLHGIFSYATLDSLFGDTATRDALKTIYRLSFDSTFPGLPVVGEGEYIACSDFDRNRLILISIENGSTFFYVAGSNKIESRSINPDMLDRSYWEIVSLHGIFSYATLDSLFRDMATRDALKTIYRLSFDSTFPGLPVVGEGEYIACSDFDRNRLILISIENGSTFFYVAGSNKIESRSINPDMLDFVCVSFDELSELRSYEFDINKMYLLTLQNGCSSITGSSGKYLGRYYYTSSYDPVTDENIITGRYLEFALAVPDGTVFTYNLDSGICNKENIALQRIEAEHTSVWKNKTAAFFGDSLTEENYHYTKGYHKWVQEILGLASYHNYGKSGYDISDIYEKVCLATDPADIVFVMGGVNDQTHSIPLGTISDNTTETTYGALNLLCEKLVERYPTSVIVFITPHFQTKYPHNDGVTSYDIRNAIIDVCEKYSICVYDNFINSGFRNNNLSLYTTDGCHWNNTAHEMVGNNLAQFVANGFRYCYGFTPKNEWIGKTVTCELGDEEDNSCHLVALVAVDEDMKTGAVVERKLVGVDCVNMTSCTVTGGNCYGDSSGAVSNASWTKACSKSSAHTQTVAGNNTATWDIVVQTLNRDVTEAYIKVPIIIGGTWPFSFKIADIAVKVNGKEKPILALGSFFASDKEIINIS